MFAIGLSVEISMYEEIFGPQLLMNSTEEYIIVLMIYYLFILGGGRELTIPKAISDTSKKTHLCSFCNKTFTRNHDLKRHVQTIHAGGKTRANSVYVPCFQKVLFQLYVLGTGDLCLT